MKRGSPGSSLIEMLVYIALLLTVFTGVFGIFTATAKYYYAIRSGIDVQQSTASITYRLARELGESNINSIVIYKADQAGVNDSYYPKNYNGKRGIVFLSPRQVTNESKGIIGDVALSTTTGKVQWSSVICYYLEAVPGENDRYKLKRKVKRVYPPLDNIELTEYSPDWFAMNTTIGNGQVVANDVYSIDIYWWKEQTTGYWPDTQINYGLYGSTGNDHTTTDETVTPTDRRNPIVNISITTSKVNSNNKVESIVIQDKIMSNNND